MDRKNIVQVLSEHFQVKPQYLGAPSFAYRVGDYTVARDGSIVDKQGQEMELEKLLGKTAPAAEEETELETMTNQETAEKALEVQLPLEGYQGQSLKNLLHMIYNKQPLIKKALGIATDLVSEEVTVALSQSPMVTLEHFKKAMEGKSCPGIDFDYEKETITFKLGQGGDDPEKIKAATQLLELLNKSARQQKRNVSAKVKPTDNEKYTFRTWLLRLGMIGDEYKEARKVLLKNLSGNAAFKKRGQVE